MSNKPRPILDLNVEPLRVADHLTLHETTGRHYDVTFCTLMYILEAEGGFSQQPVVTARLRFSPEMARAVVSGLTQQLAQVESLGKARN